MLSLSQYILEASDIQRLDIKELTNEIMRELYNDSFNPDIEEFSGITTTDVPEEVTITSKASTFVVEVPTFSKPNIPAYKFKRTVYKIGGAGGWGGRKILSYNIDDATDKKLGYSSNYTQNDWIASKVGSIISHYLKNKNLDITAGYTVKCIQIKDTKKYDFDCAEFDKFLKKEMSTEDILDWKTSLNKNKLFIHIQLETGKGYGMSHNEESFEFYLSGKGYLPNTKLNPKKYTADSIVENIAQLLNEFFESNNIPFNKRPTALIINTYQDLE